MLSNQTILIISPILPLARACDLGSNKSHLLPRGPRPLALPPLASTMVTVLKSEWSLRGLLAPSFRYSPSPRNTGPPQDRASNSCNYILDDPVNGLAKKSDYSNNNKDGENIIDKGKAENYSDRSDDSGDIDNNASDGDSDGDKGNEARGCVESPTPIQQLL